MPQASKKGFFSISKVRFLARDCWETKGSIKGKKKKIMIRLTNGTVLLCKLSQLGKIIKNKNNPLNSKLHFKLLGNVVLLPAAENQ